MRTKRIFAVVVALGLVAGNVWPHDIVSDVDVETSAEVVAEQEPQPAVADSVTMAADTVKKQNFFKKVGAYFKRSNHFDPSKKIDFGVIGGPFYASATGVGIGLVASGLYRIDRNDVTLPLSNVSIFANVATSGMMALGVRGNNVFPRERYKLATARDRPTIRSISTLSRRRYGAWATMPAISTTMSGIIRASSLRQSRVSFGVCLTMRM